jgi:hypothetical protein
VERSAIFGVPRGPLLGDFPNSSVRGTRDIADYPVEQNSLISARRSILILEIGEFLGHMVDDNDIGSVQSVHLVSEHISAFRISVISHHKALRNLRVGSFKFSHLTRHDHF